MVEARPRERGWVTEEWVGHKDAIQILVRLQCLSFRRYRHESDLACDHEHLLRTFIGHEQVGLTGRGAVAHRKAAFV